MSECEILEELKKGNFSVIKESPLYLIKKFDFNKLSAMAIGCGKNKDISALGLIYLAMDKESRNPSIPKLTYGQLESELLKYCVSKDRIQNMTIDECYNKLEYEKIQHAIGILQSVAIAIASLKHYNKRANELYNILKNHELKSIRIVLCGHTIEPEDFVDDKSARISNLAIERISFEEVYANMDEEEKKCIDFLTKALNDRKISSHCDVKEMYPGFENNKDEVIFRSKLFKEEKATWGFGFAYDLFYLTGDNKYAAYFLHQLLKEGIIELASNVDDSYYKKYRSQMLLNKKNNC